MSWFFKSWRPAEKKDQARELRIATSESYSIRTSVEPLSVDGAGSYTSASKLRAALFVPEQSMTIKFHPESTKKSAARGQCVHSIEMFTRSETATILEDARRVGASIGWSDRGVSLPTQDVLVQHLSKESQDAVHRAIREKLLPFARRHYPHLNGALDKQPYPRPGNLFIVRYCASSARPGGRGLKLHKDETALTFNLTLSHETTYSGGGTYFPAASSEVDGILLRPNPGHCIVHDGNIKHAGNEVVDGQRFILVGFYNADGRDRAGEECYFSKSCLEAQHAHALRMPPNQTVYFTTAVVSARGAASTPTGATPAAVTEREKGLPPKAEEPTGGELTLKRKEEGKRGDGGWAATPPLAPMEGWATPLSEDEVTPICRMGSSVAIQGPVEPQIEDTPLTLTALTSAPSAHVTPARGTAILELTEAERNSLMKQRVAAQAEAAQNAYRHGRSPPRRDGWTTAGPSGAAASSSTTQLDADGGAPSRRGSAAAAAAAAAPAAARSLAPLAAAAPGRPPPPAAGRTPTCMPSWSLMRSLSRGNALKAAPDVS